MSLKSLKNKRSFPLSIPVFLPFFILIIINFLPIHAIDIGVAQITEKGEDRFKHEKLSNDLEFYAVYDGHGGSGCVEYIERRLHRIFLSIEDEEANSTSAKIEIAFLKADDSWLRQADGDESGSTAVVALVDQKTGQLTIANTGDSRAVLIRNSKVIFNTKDHKPDSRDEYKRITDAGGQVINGRIQGILSVSRSFGDKDLKEWVIPDPDVTELSLEEDDLIILASDGLWGVISSQYAASFVQERLRRESLDTIAHQLAKRAEQEGSGDDITVLIYRNNKTE